MKASVIILAKNPGSIFTAVLGEVRTQETDWPYEIIVVDNGSNDGTLEFVRSHTDVRLIQIPPADFGHGRTRNFAISEARGEFCALLTHDARPASKTWLSQLVNAVAQSPDIAGAFGPHLAYPAHSPYVHRDLHAHFEGFKQFPLVLSRDTDSERYANDPLWRQVLHFYSDNNSCLRRSAWEEIPYPDVDFAEDQIWASSIIDAGWKKAYAPEAAVFHSHEYRCFEQLRRAFDESLSFRRLFEYQLGGNFWETIRTGADLSGADWRWGRSHDIPISRILHRICNNFALSAGHSLGARGDQFSGRVRNFLSRDKKIYQSGRK